MRRAWLAALLVLDVAAARHVSADTWRPLEVWRIESGRVAPWAQAGTKIDPAYQEREIRFQDPRVIAPSPLACDGAKYEWIFGGPEGLFEGNLPAPAAQAATRLGLGDGQIATLRVSCTNAGFDFHRTSGGDLLLGLDNVVWTLRPVRPASIPADVVQELLVTHFTHEMAFTSESIGHKRGFLSVALQARITRYLAARRPPDEVPPIDGDPFTTRSTLPFYFTRS